LAHILVIDCQEFTAESVGERTLKIGQHLEKLEAKNRAVPFSRHGVFVFA